MKSTISLVLVLVLGLTAEVAKAATNNQAPIADAGLSRYAAQNPVVLDGTGSYDPDNSGTLSYTWRQIAGPSVIIIDANSAKPTIAESMQPGKGRDKTPKPVGFIQTDEIQKCEFELVVSDGELTSLSGTVKVIIVPNFGENSLRLYNNVFDPNKPTIIYFGGGDCIVGYTNPNYGPRLPFKSSEWTSKANIIWHPDSYGPDLDGHPRTYYRYGDMIITYLSAVAPDYKQLIQTSGWSTGGQPAIDAAIRLNLTYKDPRYAVNHVSLLDAVQYCRDYTTDIPTYLSSSVEGEQCWVDNYISTIAEHDIINPSPSFPLFHDNVLNIVFDKYEDSSINWLQQHYLGNDWYGDSFSNTMALQFNSGIIGGAYWSVIGPGKNLQLASATNTITYKFRWYGDSSSGHMDFLDEINHPGRLPEPVTLVGPLDGAVVDANGVVLSCEISENAIGYQLLFGSEPYRVMDYMIVSDTPGPPSEVITSFPYEQTWWTVRVYDAFGSTIYADPICIYPEKVEAPEPNLVAYWKLDETEGDIAYDSAGNNHGTLNGDPQWVSGIIDGALEFDGDGDYVDVGSVGISGNVPKTVAGWAKASTTDIPSWTSVFGFAHNGSGNTTYHDIEVDDTGHYVTHIAGYYTPIIAIDAEWHHLVFTWDAIAASGYVDGQLIYSADAGGAILNTVDEVIIGARLSYSNYFPGIIDDVRIYNVALSAEEIAALAQ